jgi:hypothetical protein
MRVRVTTAATEKLQVLLQSEYREKHILGMWHPTVVYNMKLKYFFTQSTQ